MFVSVWDGTVRLWDVSVFWWPLAREVSVKGCSTVSLYPSIHPLLANTNVSLTTTATTTTSFIYTLWVLKLISLYGALLKILIG